MGCSQVFSMKRLWKYVEQAERIILWHLIEAFSQARVTSQKASVCGRSCMVTNAIFFLSIFHNLRCILEPSKSRCPGLVTTHKGSLSYPSCKPLTLDRKCKCDSSHTCSRWSSTVSKLFLWLFQRRQNTCDIGSILLIDNCGNTLKIKE